MHSILFQLYLKIFSKMKQDSAERIIVVPFWPIQIWYQLLVSTPILLTSRKSLLVLPHTSNQEKDVEKDGHIGGSFVRLFVESK